MSLSSTDARICICDRSFAIRNNCGVWHARDDGLPELDGALDDDAVDGRVDLRVRKILPRAVERDLRALHVGPRDGERVLRVVELDLGEHLALEQLLVAREFALGLLELRLVALDAGLRIAHGLLGQRRVDAGDELALLHVIVEVDARSP